MVKAVIMKDNVKEKKNSVITIDGKEYELIFTMKATMEIEERYGGFEKFGDILQGNAESGKQFREINWALTLLANQSVLIHNYKNPQDRKDLLDEEIVSLFTNIYSFQEYAEKIARAMSKDMNREVESEDDEKNKRGG